MNYCTEDMHVKTKKILFNLMKTILIYHNMINSKFSNFTLHHSVHKKLCTPCPAHEQFEELSWVFPFGKTSHVNLVEMLSSNHCSGKREGSGRCINVRNRRSQQI